MSATFHAHTGDERIDTSRLWWVGLLAAVTSVVANAAVGLTAVAWFAIPAEFRPLTPTQFTLFTIVGVGGAVAVFAYIVRVSERPVTLFRKVALAVLVVSLLPDVALLVTGAVPGTSLAAIVTLTVMHVVPAAITVAMLTTMTREA